MKLTSKSSWKLWQKTDFAVRQMARTVMVMLAGDFKACFPGGKNFFAREKRTLAASWYSKLYSNFALRINHYIL